MEKLGEFTCSLGDLTHKLILVGDLNVCALKPEFQQIQSFCNIMNMRQIINSPTHNDRLIDHIYVAHSLTVQSHGIASPIEKLHSVTWGIIEFSVERNEHHQQATWVYRKANWDLLNRRLLESNALHAVQMSSSVDEAACILHTSVVSAMHECIPKAVIGRSRKQKNWISGTITELYKQKEVAYRKWKVNQSNPSLKSKFKQLVKKLRKEIVVAKRKLFFDTFSQCHDSQSFWRALNSFSGRNVHSSVPPLFKEDGDLTNCDSQKANVLSKFLSSVFVPAQSNSCETDENESGEFESICRYQTTKHLFNKINKMSTKKATGSDGIPVIVIKRCSTVLVPCLVNIVERCLSEGAFPQIWKEAIIVPVPKVKNSPNPTDYRPISLLPVMSKLVESVVNDIVSSHTDRQLSDSQFGFRKHRSTVDALLLLQHYILRGFQMCEEGKVPAKVAVVYFDISKAFDTVPHSNLIHCIKTKFHLRPNLVKLLKSYLSERTMKVKIGSAKSDSQHMSSGVPQGSVLGPALFVLYINSVTEQFLSAKSNIILYADDMALVHPLDEVNALDEIQEDVNKINAAIHSHGLRLNARKCKFQIIALNSSEGNESCL
jgi:hypothetical protein